MMVQIPHGTPLYNAITDMFFLEDKTERKSKRLKGVLIFACVLLVAHVVALIAMLSGIYWEFQPVSLAISAVMFVMLVYLSIWVADYLWASNRCQRALSQVQELSAELHTSDES